MIDLTDTDDPAVRLPSTTLEDAARSGLPRSGLLSAGPWALGVKRALDILLSAVVLLVLSPLMLATTLAIRLTSRGPALFRQERVGRAGSPFKMLKFRSMHHRSHEDKHVYLGLNEVTGPIFKIRHDPRLTRVGRLIRRVSIDELPQLINVLRGDMSLVGPRPPLPEEFAVYKPHERQRLLVKPGLTCIWQVSGRSELDFGTWVEMDLEYIRSWTLATDLKLLARTIPAVLMGRGAY